MLPLIPFAQLPRKEWNRKAEKKERLVWQGDDFVPAKKKEVVEEKEYESDDSSEYDLLDHIASLLPEYANGKQVKKANEVHLQDMRYKAPPVRPIARLISGSLNYIKGWKARERERRKHYIIKELEDRVKKFDEDNQQRILEEIEAEEKAIKLESHRKELRIQRNSKKKKEKNELADSFVRDLDARDKAAKQMMFYCEKLPVWRIEGQRREEEETARKNEEQKILAQRVAEAKTKAARERRVKRDQELLLEDEKLSHDIETLMLRYGTISIKPKRTEHDSIESIFSNARQARLESLASSEGFVDDEDEDSLTANSGKSAFRKLDLHLRGDIDLLHVERSLRKNKFKREKRGAFVNPFETDLDDCGDVNELKGHAIKEVGAMSLAVDLSRGACAMLEKLELRHCQVRDVGLARIVQAMKMSNLTTIRVMDLRGNFLTVRSIDYMKEIATSGVFQNLDSLLLDQNELRDIGTEGLLRILFMRGLPVIRVISLSWNSITDVGFRALVNSLGAIHEMLAPMLQVIILSNNLISAGLRRELSPLPSFICV